MRAMSLQVDERVYKQFKALSVKTGRSVDELIREAMNGYLARGGPSAMGDLQPQDAGNLLGAWTRKSLYDEMTAS